MEVFNDTSGRIEDINDKLNEVKGDILMETGRKNIRCVVIGG